MVTTTPLVLQTCSGTGFSHGFVCNPNLLPTVAVVRLESSSELNRTISNLKKFMMASPPTRACLLIHGIQLRFEEVCEFEEVKGLTSLPFEFPIAFPTRAIQFLSFLQHLEPKSYLLCLFTFDLHN